MNFLKKNHEHQSRLKKKISKLKLLAIILFISTIGFAQNGINYKALIKDVNGNVVNNQIVSFRFSIQFDNGDGSPSTFYEEEQSSITDQNGIAILEIGQGVVLSGDFSTIPWERFNLLNVQIDIDQNGTFIDFGSEFISATPRTFYATRSRTAETAENITGLEAIDEGNGIGWRLIGQNPIYYGNIGENAIDLSYGNTALLGFGATGLNSFASGFLNTASGDYATSFGAVNDASGSYSTAMGRNTQAIGDFSTSLGRFSNASGEASTAMGSTIASGDYSTSIGYQAEASGEASLAMGIETEAIGNASTAFGTETVANGQNSATFGFDTYASNSNSFATGSSTEASGSNSTAMGRNTRATSSSSFAAGYESYASGSYSVALGSFSVASGTNSFAFGESSLANENHAVAIGEGVSALGINTTSIGYSSNAIGRESLAIGRGLIAQGYGQTVVGSFNEAIGTFPNPAQTPYGNEPVFIVGSGANDGNRSNAFTVLYNRNVGIGTSLPEERLHIIGRLRIGTETIEDTGSNQLTFGGSLLPSNNNAYRLGNSSSRWIGVWATDGTINTSDRRSKTNIASINYGLEDIMKLNPVSFNWKTNPNEDTKLGLIAQDLLKVIPEVVKTHDWETDEEGNKIKKELERMGVYYSDLVPVLIKAIQEQQHIINDQKEVNNSQKAELVEVKQNYKSLLSRIEILENKQSN